MPLQDLPIELFLLIAKQLSDVDRQCLRITCSGFRQIIAVAKIPVIPRYFDRDDCPPPFNFQDPELRHYEFLKRLIKPGNLFSGQDTLLCGSCIRLKDKNLYFPMKDLKIDDKPICGDCVLMMLRGLMPAGHKQSYNGKDFYTCESCGFTGEGDEIHHHTLPYPHQDNVEYLCEDCHWDVCSLPGCHGWPLSLRKKESLREYFFPFIDNSDDEQDEDDNEDRCQCCGGYHDTQLLHPDDYVVEDTDDKDKADKTKKTVGPVDEIEGKEQGIQPLSGAASHLDDVNDKAIPENVTEHVAAVSKEPANPSAGDNNPTKENGLEEVEEGSDDSDDTDSEYDWEAYCKELTSMELKRAAAHMDQKRIDHYFHPA